MNIFRTLLHELENGREISLGTVVGGEQEEWIGSHVLYNCKGGTVFTDGPDKSIFTPIPEKKVGIWQMEQRGKRIEWMIEPFTPPPTLIIFGSGHIAGYLATMARFLSFRVLIVDDRPEYANPQKFTQADEIHCGPFPDIIEQIPFHSQCYAVIVTRGHRTDAVCLANLLARPIPYIGMVGSERKIRFIFELLEEQGLDPRKQANLFSPVGLDFHSETPQEIAFSILAEIQQYRSGGTGRPLSSLDQTDKVHPYDEKRMRQDIELFSVMANAMEEGKKFASLMIIHTSGHVPRGVGSRAIVWEDGRIYRTVGGGRRENEMMEIALECLKSGTTHREEVHFSGAYHDVQPVCGGRYSIFIQPFGCSLPISASG